MERYLFELPQEKSVRVENVAVSIFTERGSAREEGAPQALHTHSYAEAFICEEGELTVVTENGVVKACVGDGILVPAHTLHFLKDSENVARKTVFGIGITRKAEAGRDLYLELMERLASKEPIRLKDCGRLCDTLRRLETADGADETFLVISVLSELCGCTDKAPLLSADGDQRVGEDLHRMIKLEGLLNSYFDTEINASRLAEMLYITERHLARIVKRHYGKTLRRVIVDKRLSAAALMLSQTAETAEGIGRAVGFSAKSAFYREFRRTYGITPKEYRRVCK